MERGTRGRRRGVPYDVVLRRHLKDPAVARAYEEMTPEFEIIKQVIALRNERNMTQAELARLVGTKQPSIARLEANGQIGSLSFLKRVVGALGATVEVKIVPNEDAKPARRAGGSNGRID